MGNYVCKKQISFGYKNYGAGEIVPEGVVLPARASSLIRSGYISVINSGIENKSENASTELQGFKGLAEEMQITVPIHTENGNMEMLVGTEEIVKALCIMQMPVSDAETEIKNVNSEATLIILDACDSRKGIKNTASARAKVISEGSLREDKGKEPEKITDGQMGMSDLEESVGEA